MTTTNHTLGTGRERPDPNDPVRRRRPMNAQRKAEVAERREQVAALVLAGVSQRQMAVLLGVSKSQINEDVAMVHRWHRESAASDIQAKVVQQDAEIRGLMRAWMPLAMNPGSVTDASLEQAKKAADTVLKLLERQAKLWGLDAPVRAVLTGEGGGPIRFEGTAEAQAVANQAVAQFVLRRAQQLEAERAALEAGETPAGETSVIDVNGSEHG